MSAQKFSCKRTLWLTITFLVVGASALVAWGGVQIFAEIPFEAEWASSGHADAAAEAFTHRDADDPPQISTRCIQCHQGRKSMNDVDDAIADSNLPDDDTVDGSLRFQNIHYAAAGATQFGAEVLGGYQYAGKSYDVRFAHVEGIDTCIDCHDPHSLEVEVELCSAWHEGVATHEDLEKIRFLGSTSDYDGDGDVNEGIHDESGGLREILYGAIQAYAAAARTPIVYTSSHPYFFIDTNGNGQADEGEISRSNRYNAFTPRLLQATYNYQYAVKDPGAFAHNGKYVIQVLSDSIEDISAPR